jgi:TonB-dependent SusC/RagA subfamily outer membrane receptor
MTTAARAVLGLLLVAAACSAKSGRSSQAQPVNSATKEDWKGQSPARAEELFIGRFPGVQVLQSGGGLIIRIRGANSINGSNEPLYVIDDMPIEPGPGGALVGINPQDIEKIEVLKDAGSTGLYGSRGANGVVLIRTVRTKK